MATEEHKETRGEKKRIVVIGSGFGGVYAYRELVELLSTSESLRSQLEVVLISENDRFEFIPLIHEVATGNLSPSSVWQSIRVLPQIAESVFVQGRVVEVDVDKKVVVYDPLVNRNEPTDPTDKENIFFDYLIVAIGSQSCYFGIPGAEKYAISLKTIDDARRIRSLIINRFEEASRIEDEQKKKELLHFVVVGGGPTGVELVGEMADVIHKELKKAFPAIYPYAALTLIDGSDRLLKQADRWFSKKAMNILEQKGVQCLLDKKVNEIKEDEVVLSSGERVRTKSVFWTAGVQARDLLIQSTRPIERDEFSHRIKVTPTLNLSAYRNVFVVGDAAWVLDRETQKPYTMRAQFAVREGQLAAQNIIALVAGDKLTEFEWRDRGFIVSLGIGGALAEVAGIKFSGPLAWFMYRTAYFFKLLGVRAKVKTGVEWFVNLFTPRDLTEL